MKNGVSAKTPTKSDLNDFQICGRIYKCSHGGIRHCILINYLGNISMHCIALHCIVHGNYVFSLFSHLLTQVACKIKFNVLNLITN